MNRWPFFSAAAWGMWRLFYAVLAVVVVALLAPIVGLTAYPAYHWLGPGWAVVLFALLVFATRNSRRQWRSDARRVVRKGRR
jgi:hypothetical protein